MSELFLFVRPPRPLWPFNGPGSAFWPPLAFASLAAALREGVPDVRVGILDAPASRMGWTSLSAELARLRGQLKREIPIPRVRMAILRRLSKQDVYEQFLDGGRKAILSRAEPLIRRAVSSVPPKGS